MPLLKHISLTRICTLFVIFCFTKNSSIFAQTGINDTITVSAVIYNGDTIEAKTLSTVELYTRFTNEARAQWTRLRNAVYVTYPYAVKAGMVLNDINAKLANVTDNGQRRRYIKSREKELKKEFSDPLTNLSVYQGRVLMKLINRETGNNCYEIVKEYKGGLTARFYQTVAFFYNSSLKQPYDAAGEDLAIENFVKEVCRYYGYRYTVIPQIPRSLE